MVLNMSIIYGLKVEWRTLYWVLANCLWWKWIEIVALSLMLTGCNQKARHRWSSYWSPSSSSEAAPRSAASKAYTIVSCW